MPVEYEQTYDSPTGFTHNPCVTLIASNCSCARRILGCFPAANHRQSHFPSLRLAQLWCDDPHHAVFLHKTVEVNERNAAKPTSDFALPAVDPSHLLASRIQPTFTFVIYKPKPPHQHKSRNGATTRPPVSTTPVPSRQRTKSKQRTPQPTAIKSPRPTPRTAQPHLRARHGRVHAHHPLDQALRPPTMRHQPVGRTARRSAAVTLCVPRVRGDDDRLVCVWSCDWRDESGGAPAA